MRACAVEDCARPAQRRGWCDMHYKRWWRTGDPLTVRPPGHAPSVCTVEDCGRAVHGRGYCLNHYQRWRRGKDPHVPPVLRGPESPRWVPRECLDYDTLHERLKLQRGHARGQACIACGRPAEQWAYQYTDPAPLVSVAGCLFTDDLDAYAAMCRPCHRALDRAHREASA